MKKSSMLAVCFVAVSFFVCILGGCQHVNNGNEGENKDDKISDFLNRYGNKYAEQMYNETRYKILDATFNDFNHEITSLAVKSVRTREGSGVSYHLVKCKMTYKFTDKNDKNNIIKYIRYMSLAIEEDGYGNMMADSTKSKEIFVAGATDEIMSGLFLAEMNAGEEMIKK